MIDQSRSDGLGQEPPREPWKIKLLSFEEFSHRQKLGPCEVPEYNNFFVFFRGDRDAALGESKQPGYKAYARFRTERADLDSQIRVLVSAAEEKFTKEKGDYRGPFLEPADRLLYEAYKIMRNYGANNVELFA